MDKTVSYSRLLSFAAAFVLVAAFAMDTEAQIDDICREFGYIATLEAPRLTAPFVFGRVTISNADGNAKLPVVSITYQNRSATPERITIGRSGNYCFRITVGAGGTLILERDGVEVARRNVSTFGAAQQREDFEVAATGQALAQTGVISGRFYRPPNSKTAPLYEEAAKLEGESDLAGAVKALQKIVEIDPEDFAAWSLLGGLQIKDKKFTEAEASLRRSIMAREDYVPAWINAGMLRIAKKEYEAAIVVLDHASELEPTSARVFQLLGEAYLLSKQGNLGAAALNKAIELDPSGMAECHLQLAHLYQLAKQNKLAAEEYKKFLKKKPDHPDRAKFEKFVSANK